MVLTEHELSIIPSVVAIVAIAGTLVSARLTNRSTLKAVQLANQNALKIAEAERSSRREDELLALKRTMYAKLLADLSALVKASMLLSAVETLPLAQRMQLTIQRMNTSMTAADSLANVSLVAPVYVNSMATEVYTVALNVTVKDVASFIREGAKLRATMQADLRGDEFSSPEELDRMADISLARDASIPLYVGAFKETDESPDKK
jgi:type II secretory pathway pseudopilin PulG